MHRTIVKIANRIYSPIFNRSIQNFCSTTAKNDGESTNSDTKDVKRGRFADAFEELKHLDLSSEGDIIKEQEQSAKFTTLLRNSKFMQLGGINGKEVAGKIFHVVGDDLYIEFGGKFNCVCQRPRKNAHEYRRGVEVRIRLTDLEMSTRFLGAISDVTLLEADATLLGLRRRKLHT